MWQMTAMNYIKLKDVEWYSFHLNVTFAFFHGKKDPVFYLLVSFSPSVQSLSDMGTKLAKKHSKMSHLCSVSLTDSTTWGEFNIRGVNVGKLGPGLVPFEHMGFYFNRDILTIFQKVEEKMKLKSTWSLALWATLTQLRSILMGHSRIASLSRDMD